VFTYLLHKQTCLKDIQINTMPEIYRSFLAAVSLLLLSSIPALASCPSMESGRFGDAITERYISWEGSEWMKCNSVNFCGGKQFSSDAAFVYSQSGTNYLMSWRRYSDNFQCISRQGESDVLYSVRKEAYSSTTFNAKMFVITTIPYYYESKPRF
jgi:hypothetical protein